MPGLGEITRNTVTTYEIDRDACDPDEASKLLQSAFETRVDNTSVSANEHWDRVQAVVGRVPQLNKWFFTYGLFDCAIQLSQTLGPGLVASGLRRTLQRLAFESPEEHFRWKAIEFFLCHQGTRQEQRERLEDEATGRPADAQIRIRSEIKAVYSALYEEEPSDPGDASTSRSSSIGT